MSNGKSQQAEAQNNGMMRKKQLLMKPSELKIEHDDYHISTYAPV